jgi:hypothetical protein
MQRNAALWGLRNCFALNNSSSADVLILFTISPIPVAQQRAAIKHKLITRNVHVFATAIKIFPLFLYVQRSRRCDSGGSSWASAGSFIAHSHTLTAGVEVLWRKEQSFPTTYYPAACVIFEAARKITPF